MSDEKDTSLNVAEAPKSERLFWVFSDDTISGAVARGLTTSAFVLAALTPPIAAEIEKSAKWLWLLGWVCIAFSIVGAFFVFKLRDIGTSMRDTKYADVSAMQQEITSLKDENSHYRKLDEISRRMSSERFDRWENISDDDGEDVKVGYVPFNPTAINSHGSAFRGIGPDLIRHIFGDRVKIRTEPCSWGNVFDQLIDGDIEIIGTPLYDTKERSDVALFSVPLFYADIGMYCARPEKMKRARDRTDIIDIPSTIFENREPEAMTFMEAQAVLMDKDHRRKILGTGEKYRLNVAANELNAKLAKRRFERSVEIKYVSDSRPFEVSTAIAGLLDKDNAYHSAFVFCERAQAESTEEFKNGTIINLIKESELLFPVCFAVRKCEDTIRKFVNMRLLDLENTVEGGITALIAKSAAETNGIDKSKSDTYFRRFDFPITDTHLKVEL